ncbi:TPA: hypothetical protein ACGPDC_000308 [Streptococcus suis]
MMVLLDYRENQKIAYTWDSAVVSFTLSQLENQTLIPFEERIPEDFGNEFANAQKDMTMVGSFRTNAYRRSYI